ncbi:rod shape-determining protein MreC [Porphyromonas crevioricanis]|uniref:Cell shape-determining protein MreC n=1 Tax=Porphyromonas crevioricanis TaxID=393921 RepID=A0AB34PE48_9PORP|nr:rod shape-determining protein MreC [Porphyromonas crevioricanis]KGN93701.1 hypothetical protein HQ38_08680 [Porphyromonas crevioricanis]
MSRLFAFFARYKHWLVFLVLEIVALTVLFNDSLYHRSIALVATNRLLGRVNATISSVGEYVRLKEQNKSLLQEIASLEARYYMLERDIQRAAADTVRPVVFALDSGIRYSMPNYVTARVIRASNRKTDNYLSIDKGTRNGIAKDMSVMSATGVVGTVAAVSESCALVVPLINSKLRLSCRIKGRDFVGSLSWDNPSDITHARLSDLPRHATVKVGDTVVTSGYSFTYLPNLIVGTIENEELDHKSIQTTPEQQIDISSHTNFSSVPVRLATDFSRLSFVYVFTEQPSPEIQRLQDSLPTYAR